MASHWTENILIIIVIGILLPIIIYWNSLPDDRRWAESPDYYEESHRSKRSASYQALFGKIQNIQDCCVVPALIPNLTLQKCGGNVPVKIQVKNNQRLFVTKQEGSGQTAVIDNGLFATIRQIFARSRFGKKKKRHINSESHENYVFFNISDALDNAILENLRQIFPKQSRNIYYDIDDETQTMKTNEILNLDNYYKQSEEQETLINEHNSRQNNKEIDRFHGFMKRIKRQEPETAPPPDITTPEPELPEETAPTVLPIPTFQPKTPSILKFRVAAVCYTDCVFRDLQWIGENNTLLVADAFPIIYIQTVVPQLKTERELEKWRTLLINAIPLCYYPAIEAKPEQIQLISGRICSTRPIFYLSCVRRYLYQACAFTNDPKLQCLTQLKKGHLEDIFT